MNYKLNSATQSEKRYACTRKSRKQDTFEKNSQVI